MRKSGILLLLSFWGGIIFCQVDSATFEDYGLKVGEFINGKNVAGPFLSGTVSLDNQYFADYDYWSGWAISRTDDQTTRGYTNQYTVRNTDKSHGAAAIGYFSGAPMVIHFTGSSQVVKSIDFANTVYAYWSMAEGDSFSKKFGGEGGTDPDYFRAILKGHYGDVEVGTETIYLADFRSNNSSEDYILDDWKTIHLEDWGALDSITITMESSDVGQFGINTPTYLAIDNVVTEVPETLKLLKSLDDQEIVTFYPNPSKDFIFISGPNQKTIYLYDMMGRQVLKTSDRIVSIQHLPKGSYLVKIDDGKNPTIKTLQIQ